MHVLKSLVSGLLLLTSVIWLGIQQLFLPDDIVSKLFVGRTKHFVDFLQLKRDWCRVRSKKISWREIKESCQSNLFMIDRRFATNPRLSQVSHVAVKPAGEHTRVRIDTFTSFGTLKNFGGDSYRVIFRGPNVASAAVFDLRNGSYDALVFLMDPGVYSIKVILDYTQCNGLKDPPTEWYFKAHCAGRGNRTTVPAYVSSQMSEYLNTEISPGITITVPEPRYDVSRLPRIVNNTECGFACNQMWDGHGVWQVNRNYDYWEWNNIIQPVKQFQNPTYNKLLLSPRTLWIYGDSISYYFYNRLKDQDLCTNVFTSCRNTYNWIYPKTLYEMEHFCEDLDVNIERVAKFFRQVINDPSMGAQSVLIFNLGAHFVKNTSFRKYRKIIDALLRELKSFKGRVVWKSTAAIHGQDIKVMGSFRRYLTDQRVQLFNAYGNAALCNAKHQILDVYPLTASFPHGTKDGVHYHRNASAPMERMLNRYFNGIKASLENTVGI